MAELSGGLGEVKAELSYDTDTIEQVHDRLIRKGVQNQNRQAVITDALGWAAKNSLFAGVSDLVEILTRDCDS